MKRFLAISLCILLLGGAGMVGSYYYLLGAFWQREGAYTNTQEVWIPPGTSSRQIIDILEQQGVINQPLLFRLFAMRFGELTRYKAGEYALVPSLSPAQISSILAMGKTLQRSVTIPEGWLSAQIVATLNAEPKLEEVLTSTPPEGSLLPETYFFIRGQAREKMLMHMQTAMRSTLHDLWKNRQPNLPLNSPEEALILASIVEKETGMVEERARVAAVFINRLRLGMKLQSDPTANYGLYLANGELKTRMSREDVLHASDYNTYVINGLPPTPICNPGKASIAAVLNPDATDELYFVADGKGGHVFANTLAEHNRNIAEYRRVLQQNLAE
jgi:UPF0755 protein